jgi:hypothetical protein
MDDWPFDQPPNCLAFTTKRIVFEGAPILYVFHDKQDHDWQFMDGRTNLVEADAALVSMANIVERDATVLEVADLPPGYFAWRDSPADEWQRARRNPE